MVDVQLVLSLLRCPMTTRMKRMSIDVMDVLHCLPLARQSSAAPAPLVVMVVMVVMLSLTIVMLPPSVPASLLRPSRPCQAGQQSLVRALWLRPTSMLPSAVAP